MAGFRISKYDPRDRAPDGSYRRDVWTSISDVGKTFDGQLVTCSDYLRTEDSYVLAVRRFVETFGQESLWVRDLEINETSADPGPPELIDEILAHVGAVTEGAQVSGPDLDWVVRLALREALWCRLVGASESYIHFGYDFYVYVGSDRLDSTPPPLPQGVFAELFESPYHEEMSD